jgi:uncharacterized protein (UPF0371 family)
LPRKKISKWLKATVGGKRKKKEGEKSETHCDVEGKKRDIDRLTSSETTRINRYTARTNEQHY